MKIITPSMFLSALIAVGACAAPPATPGEAETDAEALTQKICTPGEQTCDFGCFFQGGPSSSDCIIKCNARGTAWKTITDCGWAQNFPFSSSCLIADPPRCENN